MLRHSHLFQHTLFCLREGSHGVGMVYIIRCSVCVAACAMSLCTLAWGLERGSWCPALLLLVILPWGRSLTEPGFRLATSNPQSFPYLCPSQCWSYRFVAVPGILHGCCGFKPRLTCLCSVHSYPLRHLSIPWRHLAQCVPFAHSYLDDPSLIHEAAVEPPSSSLCDMQAINIG